MVVSAYQADIEAETREVEVVRVSPKLPDRHLRGKDELDVCIALLAVQIVDAALIEGHYIASCARIGTAALLDFRFFRIQGLVSFIARFSRKHRLYFSRD